MEKPQLFVILGQSNAGKDTLRNDLVKRFKKLSKIIATTTRPIRPNETQGVEYHFVKDIPDNLIAPRRYDVITEHGSDVWYYGLDPKDLTNNGVIILDYIGFKELYAGFSDAFCIHGYYLDVDYQTRLKRAQKRDTYNLKEMKRRLRADEKAFANVSSDKRIKTFNNPSDLTNDLIQYLN